MKKFDNYCSNLSNLQTAGTQELDNPFIISGIISMFFLQFELGWKVLKELLQYEGRIEGASGSPREILKAAFDVYAFLEEDTWLSMLADRNSMVHVYDNETAKQLVSVILQSYIPAFSTLKTQIESRYANIL